MADVESIFKLVGQGPKVVTYHADSDQPQRGKWGQVDTVAEMLNPSRGVRDDMARKGIKPRDHARDNKRAAAVQSEVNRLRREGAVHDAPTVRKPPVRAAAATGRGGPAADARDLEVDVDDLDEHEPSPRRRLPAVAPQRGVRASDVRQRVQQQAASGSGRNFVKENFARAPGMHKPAQGKAPDKHLGKHKAGSVPTYLKNRKAELDEQKEMERLASLPREAPPGLRLLPEAERLETLAALQQKKSELERMFASLSMTSTTLAHRSRVNGLEQQLKEVESAIGVFSKVKVFVAEDE
mmetsp:Transcript_4377/g.9529  ORF Transcript_4377/g.9529 Transcript_4377/m.9529 type:complete len:296 (-) Transcript_4377:57-944(-)